MTKPIIISICFVLIFCYKSNSQSSQKTTPPIRKVIIPKKAQSTDTAKASDNDDPEPSFDEVKSELLSSYNKIQRIDTIILVGRDTLHVHEKYYCLHNSTLVIPKRYLWGGNKSKDFITHEFASEITIIKNGHAIFKRTFKKSDFDKVIHPELKQYAIPVDPYLIGYKKQYNSIIFGYSISIPLTDVGVPAYVAVDLKGGYKILDEYAKTD